MRSAARNILWLLFLYNFSCVRGYSEGKRIGVITKLSYRGWLWKSWEGELIQSGVRSDGKGGAVPNTFDFHIAAYDAVNLEAARKALDSGKDVAITYNQWMLSPCSQNSDYDVVSIAEAKP